MLKPTNIKRTLAGLALAFAATAGPVPATAEGIQEPFREEFHKAMKGRTVVFVPVALAVDLAQGWLETMKNELEPLGVSVTFRDANFNTSAGAQAIESLINERPDVLVVQNPDVQTYAKLLRKAEKAGIYVIQVNMRTSYDSTAFIGVDWQEMGEKVAAASVKACAGKSGKVAVLQGALSAAASAYQIAGIASVLAQNPDIKLVSNQAADWDASKAKSITQTVLKQHPDICAIMGFWDGQDIGAAAAIKESCLTEDVFLVTSGGGEQKGTCDMVANGTFDLHYQYNVPNQGLAIADTIKWLIQSGIPAGTVKGSIYTTLQPITKDNVEGACWTLGQ